MAKRDSTLKRIFGVVWRAIAAVYALVTVAVMVIVPLAVYLAFGASNNVSVEQGVALVWEPSGALVEQRDRGLAGNIVPSLLGRSQPKSVVADLVAALDRAAHDPRIKMVFLKLDELGAASPGQLAELAAAIERFQKSGKKVVAWSPTYNQAQYRLAAHADTVYLDPMGYVFLQGYAIYQKYFAEALHKLGVNIHVFREGKYKAFVEPFIRNQMSPAARAANRALLESLWHSYKQGVAAANPWKPSTIEAYIHGLGKALRGNESSAARLAKQAGLVDKLATLPEVRDAMRAIVGTSVEHGSFRQIHYLDYLRATRDMARPDNVETTIAKIVVEGPIIVGESVPGAAGGATIARLIRSVRRDDHAAALVLRIDSPGGSVYASERIRRQVELMREAGKPVVVSMAGVAASGGYWIAMNANLIYAQKSTITGSIGVFAMMATFAEPLAKLGIHTDGLGTTPLSGVLRADRPLQPELKRILENGVQHVYDIFIHKVAKARGMSLEAVRNIAKGRVWSGADAVRIGLVDRIGGLNEAIAAAAELAGLQQGDYTVEVVRPDSGWPAMFFQFLQGRVQVSLIPDWLQGLVKVPAFNWLRHGLDDPRGIYAYCFCQLAPADAIP